LAFSDLFDFLNTKALHDDSFVTKLVAVASSRQMESFSINKKLVRHAMLEILQKNFQSKFAALSNVFNSHSLRSFFSSSFVSWRETGADHLKRDDMNKFYNSIKLLGEYFNRARITNGSPINIIGQSLLNLLNVELEKEMKNMLHFKNDDFAALILTQVRKLL
jgi:hypothetical protein